MIDILSNDFLNIIKTSVSKSESASQALPSSFLFSMPLWSCILRSSIYLWPCFCLRHSIWFTLNLIPSSNFGYTRELSQDWVFSSTSSILQVIIVSIMVRKVMLHDASFFIYLLYCLSCWYFIRCYCNTFDDYHFLIGNNLVFQVGIVIV